MGEDPPAQGDEAKKAEEKRKAEEKAKKDERAAEIKEKYGDHKEWEYSDEMKEMKDQHGLGALVSWLGASFAALMEVNRNPMFSGNAATHGPANAVLHCMLACQLALMVGEEKAKEMLDMHEDFGFMSRHTSKEGESEVDAKGELMDKHNNDVGLRCARNTAHCKICCESAVMFEKSTVWFSGYGYFAQDCFVRRPGARKDERPDRAPFEKQK